MFTLIPSVIASSNLADPSLLVALAVFINIFLFLMVISLVTGGHLNPVISVIAALEGVTTFVRAAVYFKAQCIGSTIGFLLIHTLMSQESEQNFLLGGCTLNGNGETHGLSPGDAFLLEFLCTFLLLFVGVTVAFDKKRSKEVGLPWVCFMFSVPMALGVFISMTITGKAGYSVVGLNPARCLGPAMVRGGSLWYGHCVFWFSPILAYVMYTLFFKTLPKKGFVPVQGDRDILSIGEAYFKGSTTQAAYAQK